MWCFLSGAEQSRSCCKNGGTCILGSFCACPPFFTGRSCEYDQRIRSCGAIPHGEWVQKGCSYCRCGYGTLHCFPHVFHKDCVLTGTWVPRQRLSSWDSWEFPCSAVFQVNGLMGVDHTPQSGCSRTVVHTFYPKQKMPQVFRENSN
ncbi:teratocarcinoma-derived growth factor 1 [Notothenia coriiceps]|uniref:Teratocarcinoma-derived growth factor 1 n=1 Tax=Notothenia coriiceps TaxID=8208 RepID=A0A6I9NR52_9TELE|nr:PREDICTED: teratocarcinoma-derived growth factor 1-like [Notothenia coriiceps]